MNYYNYQNPYMGNPTPNYGNMPYRQSPPPYYGPQPMRNGMPFSTPRMNGAPNPSSRGAATGGLFKKGLGKSLTLSKVLDGTQNMISTVNQAIPIYQQVKPLVSNSKVLTGALKKVFAPRTATSTASKTSSSATKSAPIEPEVMNSKKTEAKEKKVEPFKEQKEPNRPLF